MFALLHLFGGQGPIAVRNWTSSMANGGSSNILLPSDRKPGRQDEEGTRKRMLTASNERTCGAVSGSLSSSSRPVDGISLSQRHPSPDQTTLT